MRPLALSQIARWTDGALIQGVPSHCVESIATDSRKAGPGQIFVALKGNRFDAHKFIADVAEQGVDGILVHELTAETEAYGGGIVRVKNTLKGLQDLAFHYRRSLSDVFAVGVTGSNGKTSTKDFVSAVLEAAGPVNKTVGNLNNHIGLPLTILSTEAEHRFGVWEMGMNHPGEIEILAEIARPDAAILTNVGTAHIEHMGSREAIAMEKSALPMAVPRGGFCAMPIGDDYYAFVAERVSCEMLSVGIEEGSVQARNLQADEHGRTSFELCSDFGSPCRVSLPVRGNHMVQNALLAAAVGLRQGIAPAEVADRLGSVKLTGGRLQEREVNGVPFLDDSYNANPDSMRAALETLRSSTVPGRKVAVLGFMGELGDHEQAAYLELGRQVESLGIDALITVGGRAAVINTTAGNVGVNRNVDTHEEAAEFLREFLTSDDLVLVKGSRAAAMERVIEALN